MKIIIDLDDTLTEADSSRPYSDVLPRTDMIEQLRAYRARGFQIVIFTSRNMRTYEGNVGKINVHTLPTILEWLEKHDVPFDEVVVGKPWCGHGGFYVDDKAIRPSEFLNMSYEEICDLVGEKAWQ
ncbi:MAG: capsular biosynthesis protein [Alphaproteobacteria bacterium]|nr:MAG: capsular biosynthesis protein [Alphaproteobacteria bacterium]